MRVLLAPQELKGTLTAVEAAQAMAEALREAFPSVVVDLLPMADGGPGTVDALLTALGGERRVREEIRITLLHELGHHFGLGEDDLERLGYG